MRRCIARLLSALGVACLALAMIVPIPQPVAASSPPTWSEPVPIGPDLPMSWFPDINADATGTVRLVWESTLSSGDTDEKRVGAMFSQLTPSGWSKPANFQVSDGENAARPMISSDGAYIHVLFRRALDPSKGLSARLLYTRARVNTNLSDAHSWSEPKPLSDGEVYYNQMLTLPNNTLVVVYNQLIDVPIDGTIERRPAIFTRMSSDDGDTWSFPVTISVFPQRAARTMLTTSPDFRTIVVAWDEGYDNMTGAGDPSNVATATSTDGGRTWVTHPAITSPLGPIENVAVGFGKDGPLLVYRLTGKEVLYYRRGLDGGKDWSDEAVVPDVVLTQYVGKHYFDRLALAADGDGRLLVAYVGQDHETPSGSAVMVATFADGAWSQPVRVAAPDKYPEYPRLAIGLGNQIQLTYFVRDTPYVVGHYTLWVVAGRSDARPIPAAKVTPIMPTPTVRVPTVEPDHQIQAYPVVEPPPPLKPIPGERLHTPLQEVSLPAFETLGATMLALVAVVLLIVAGRSVGHWRA